VIGARATVDKERAVVRADHERVDLVVVDAVATLIRGGFGECEPSALATAWIDFAFGDGGDVVGRQVDALEDVKGASVVDKQGTRAAEAVIGGCVHRARWHQGNVAVGLECVARIGRRVFGEAGGGADIVYRHRGG